MGRKQLKEEKFTGTSLFLIVASVCVNRDVINYDHVTVGLSVQ